MKAVGSQRKPIRNIRQRNVNHFKICYLSAQVQGRLRLRLSK